MNIHITDHRIEKPLGPSGVFAGYALIVFGIIGSFYSMVALVVVLPGCFLAFTYDGAGIDFKSRRIRNYTCLFGLFRIGTILCSFLGRQKYAAYLALGAVEGFIGGA